MITLKKFTNLFIAGISLVFSPLLANEYSTKGSYITGSIGASQIGDIEVIGGAGDLIEFDAGLGLDLGYGYDFGTTRIEGSWVRGGSNEYTFGGAVTNENSTINSFVASVYYDFREDKIWSPFIGASIGATVVEFDGNDDSGVTYGFGFGLSYKTSDETEIFFKNQLLIVPELEIQTDNLGALTLENGNYATVTLGFRYRF